MCVSFGRPITCSIYVSFVRVWTPIEGRELDIGEKREREMLSRGRTKGKEGKREKESGARTRRRTLLPFNAISLYHRPRQRARVCVRCLFAPDGHERMAVRTALLFNYL